MGYGGSSGGTPGPSTVSSAIIVDGSIATADLADGSVTAAKLGVPGLGRTATGNITLAVDPGTGSDTPTVSRPAQLVSGNYTGFPFATVQAALDTLPKNLGNFDHRITVTASTSPGFLAEGFNGSGTLDIVGTMSLATLASGVNTGTADAGTTATVVKKPAAAANWTPGNLRGKIVVVTGGGGFYADTPVNIAFFGPCLRVISGNTIDEFTIEALNGVDNTTTFNIVEPGTLINASVTTYSSLTFCAGVLSNDARVSVRNILPNDNSVIYFLFVDKSHLSAFYGWKFPATGNSMWAVSNTYCTFNHNYVAGTYGSDAFFTDMTKLFMTGIVADSGQMRIAHIQDAYIVVDSLNYASAVLDLDDMQFCGLHLNANGSTVPPLELTNINQFDTEGFLTGSNPGASTGVIINGGGQYLLNGSTLSGVTDFMVEGEAFSWVQLQAACDITKHGNVVIWSTPIGAGISTASETTGDITLAVTTGGDDTDTTRPTKITHGVFTSKPFLTIQAAIDSLPKMIKHKVFVDVGAGSFGAFRVEGFVGGQHPLYADQVFRDGIMIRGSTALATLATGSASGTATGGTGGAGFELSSALIDTTQTWTINDLRRRFLRITAGTASTPNSPNIQRGFLEQVPMHIIPSNTAIQATSPGLVGAPTGSTYQIVDLTSIINSNNPVFTEQAATTFENNSCFIAIYGMKFAHATPLFGAQSAATFAQVRVARCAGRVRFLSCDIRGLSTARGMLANDCNFVNLTDTQFVLNTGYDAEQCPRFEAQFCMLDSCGAISLMHSCANAVITCCKVITPTAGGGFQFLRCPSAILQGNSECNGGTGDAVSCVGPIRITITSFTGTGISGFGISMTDSGHFNITGSTTITGTAGDMSLDGTVLTYAQKAANVRTIKDQILAR